MRMPQVMNTNLLYPCFFGPVSQDRADVLRAFVKYTVIGSWFIQVSYIVQ